MSIIREIIKSLVQEKFWHIIYTKSGNILKFAINVNQEVAKIISEIGKVFEFDYIYIYFNLKGKI